MTSEPDYPTIAALTRPLMENALRSREDLVTTTTALAGMLYACQNILGMPIERAVEMAIEGLTLAKANSITPESILEDLEDPVFGGF